MGATSLERGDLHGWMRERARARKRLSRALEGYEWAPSALIAMNRVEEDLGQRGASAKGRESGGARRTYGS
jgi:hypothetical protein